MGKHPHIGPERFGKRDFEAQEVITLVLELLESSKCPCLPSHIFSEPHMASGIIL